MRIGTKGYERITISKDGQTVCELTDDELTLAQGYTFFGNAIECSISREELLSLALYAVEEKIRAMCIKGTGHDVGKFIDGMKPLLEKRDILRKELQ